jgi:hypothetical protein
VDQLCLFWFERGTTRLTPPFNHGYDFAFDLVDVPPRRWAGDPHRKIINESHLSEGARDFSTYQIRVIE